MSEEKIINDIEFLIKCSKDKKDVLYNLCEHFKESLERYFRFI